VLIELATGDWVDPADVESVGFGPSGQDLVVVTIYLRSGGEMNIDMFIDDAPRDLREVIASQINAALAPAGRLGPAGPDLPVGAVNTKGA
jgi:hypothetical protein